MLGQKKFQSSIIAGPENKKRVLTGDSSLDRELADIILRIKNADILINLTAPWSKIHHIWCMAFVAKLRFVAYFFQK